MSEHYRGTEFVELVAQVTGSTPIAQAKGWTIQCPAHSDGSPSLSVRENDAGTKLLIHCYAGCSTKEICSALGIRISQLFYTKSENFIPKTKYERERLELDRTVGFLFRARRKNNQPLEISERQDFEAAEERIRNYVASKNRRTNKN